MNNKKGSFGAKFLLVILLMLASAVGGAYCYSVVDGKSAARDAMRAVEDVDISDYDTPEQSVIKTYIDDATKDLQSAKTRKEVNEILGDFISDVDKVQTKNEKALEQALKEAEEAKQQALNSNNNSNNDTSITTDNSGDDDSDSNGSYKSNGLNTSDEGEKQGNGLLNSLIGGLSSGAE